MKKETIKKIHHFIFYTVIILILIFSILCFCIYAYKLSNMGFKDILHFMDFISSDKSDWDTFSALTSGVLGTAIGAITLLFLIVEHYNNEKEKQEIEIQKEKEKQEIEAQKEKEKRELENEKLEERRLHQKEQEAIEKDKLTVRYIEDMENLNRELLKNYSVSRLNISLSYIFRNLNIKIEKYIYIWIMLEDIEKNNVVKWDSYKKLSESFPLRTSIIGEEPIIWDKFKKHGDLNYFYNILFRYLNLTEDIKSEILENVHDLYSKQKWLEINNFAVKKIIFEYDDLQMRDTLHRIYEHFIYALESLKNYPKGINYYFLQLPAEQRFFFLFLAKDNSMINNIKDAIKQTDFTDESKKYLIFKFLGKI